MEVVAAAHEVDAVHFVVAADLLGDFFKTEVLFRGHPDFDDRLHILGVDLFVVQKRLVAPDHALSLVVCNFFPDFFLGDSQHHRQIPGIGSGVIVQKLKQSVHHKGSLLTDRLIWVQLNSL